MRKETSLGTGAFFLLLPSKRVSFTNLTTPPVVSRTLNNQFDGNKTKNEKLLDSDHPRGEELRIVVNLQVEEVLQIEEEEPSLDRTLRNRLRMSLDEVEEWEEGCRGTIRRKMRTCGFISLGYSRRRSYYRSSLSSFRRRGARSMRRVCRIPIYVQQRRRVKFISLSNEV